MKTLKFILPLLCIIGFVVACASFATNTYRAEQTSVNLVFTAYVGWTNYLDTTEGSKVSPEARAAVKDSRLKFAATVSTLENLRAAYETNSAVKPQIVAALDTVSNQSSNVVWLISYLKGVLK